MAWIEEHGNRYRVVWDIGAPGSRVRRKESFDSWEDADRFRKKVEYETSLGLTFDPSKMSVAEYFDHWLKLHADNLAPKTLASYECEITNHIKPNLGALKLSKLSPMHLQNYYDSLKKEGRIAVEKRNIEKLKAAQAEGDDSKKLKKNIERAEKRVEEMTKQNKGGLSATTINYHHRIIHKALKQAVKWQMVNRNIADAVTPPKQVKREIEYLRREDVHKFIACIKESSDYPVILAAIYTGMRQGELLGIRWKDVDLKAGIIHVRQQLQYITGKGYFFKEPKRESLRDIPMPLPLNAVLRKIAKEQESIKEIYKESESEDYKNHDLVFCNYDGSPMDGTGVNKRFKRLLVKNGFNKITFHGLRHTFATMCRAAGMNLGDVQDLLGHADISTTKKMYTHVEIEPLRKAMDILVDYMKVDS